MIRCNALLFAICIGLVCHTANGQNSRYNPQTGSSRNPGYNSWYGNRGGQGQGPYGTNRIRIIKNGIVYDTARGDDLSASGVDMERIMQRVDDYRRNEVANPGNRVVQGQPGQGPYGTNRIRIIKNGIVYDTARGDEISASGVDLDRIMQRVDKYRRSNYENPAAAKSDPAGDKYELLPKPDILTPEKPEPDAPDPDITKADTL